jgi:ATP-dependent DNA helicase RecG
MAVYGDALSIYTISTMPNGRKPVKTFISDNDNEIFKFMKEEIDKGRQCYIVCPLITTDEKAVMKEEGITPPESVESVFEKADNYFSPYGIKVDIITGKKKENEKTEIIERFKNNESQILIATTIIEVGVNVPNATVIAIMDADRFGLSGLHQLRGRVGRSNLQSYCILKSEKEDNPRLEVMCKTTDGFKIAEEDLKLRGTGEITGVKQSGSDDKFATVLKYPNLYSRIIKFIRTGE